MFKSASSCFNLEYSQVLYEVKKILSEKRALNKYSFKNFHAYGMHYINLYYSPTLISKLYYIPRPQEVRIACPSLHYLVSPHDHSYNFKTIVLKGRMRNITFEKCSKADFSSPFSSWTNYTRENSTTKLWDHYIYHSPLTTIKKEREEEKKRESSPLEFKEQMYMREACNTLISDKGSYTLSHSQIHTIQVTNFGEKEEEPTLLFLFQKTDLPEKKGNSNLFLEAGNTTLNQEGMYQKFTEAEFTQVCSSISSLLSSS